MSEWSRPAAWSGERARHSGWGRRLLLAGCLSLLVLGGAWRPALARRRQSLTESDEWRRLARVWQTMVEHSSGDIENSGLFLALASDVQGVDADLSALQARGALSRPVADYLRRLCHVRYQYIRDWHYSDRSSIRVSAFEASRNAALWVVEMQLALLRRSPLSEADEDLARAARSNVLYHLSYLYEVEQFEDEADRRRMALREKEKAGGEVDWVRFDLDHQRRRNLLLAAYNQRRLRPARVVSEAIPHVIALTQEPAVARGATASWGSPDL